MSSNAISLTTTGGEEPSQGTIFSSKTLKVGLCLLASQVLTHPNSLKFTMDSEETSGKKNSINVYDGYENTGGILMSEYLTKETFSEYKESQRSSYKLIKESLDRIEGKFEELPTQKSLASERELIEEKIKVSESHTRNWIMGATITVLIAMIGALITVIVFLIKNANAVNILVQQLQ